MGNAPEGASPVFPLRGTGAAPERRRPRGPGRQNPIGARPGQTRTGLDRPATREGDGEGLVPPTRVPVVPDYSREPACRDRRPRPQRAGRCFPPVGGASLLQQTALGGLSCGDRQCLGDHAGRIPIRPPSSGVISPAGTPKVPKPGPGSKQADKKIFEFLAHSAAGKWSGDASSFASATELDGWHVRGGRQAGQQHPNLCGEEWENRFGHP